MALRGSRIENLNESWFLGALGGYDFCVSSTSFEKSNLGWPQQPLREKELKFKMGFHDSVKKFFFFKT